MTFAPHWQQRAISPTSSDDEMTQSNGSSQFADADLDSYFDNEVPPLGSHKVGSNVVSDSGSCQSNRTQSSHRFTDADDDEFKDIETYQEVQCVKSWKGIDDTKREEEIASSDSNSVSVFSSQFHNPDSSQCGDSTWSLSSGPKERIKCKALVRSSTKVFKSLNMSRRLKIDDEEEVRQTWFHQEARIGDVLSKLRHGEINLLIATSGKTKIIPILFCFVLYMDNQSLLTTLFLSVCISESVVEEGVDVQACSFVAVFDSLKNNKSYIQMKGRARQKSAKFFVFTDQFLQSPNGCQLKSAQQIEKRIDQFIATRRQPVRRTPSREFFTGGESSPSEITACENGWYRVKHGFVDVRSAKSLCCRYASSLPLDKSARSSRESLLAHLPIYEADKLILPSHLPRELRLIILPEQYRNHRKKEREGIMSLMACVRLHRHGLLNDRLLPLTQLDLKEKVFKIFEARSASAIEIPRSTFEPFGTNGISTKTLYVYPIMQKNDNIEKLHKILKHDGKSLAIISTHPTLDGIPELDQYHPTFGCVTLALGEKISFDCTETHFKCIQKFFKLLMDTRWRRRSTGMYHRPKELPELSKGIPPYWVGCLTSQNEGKTRLDFQYMLDLVIQSKRSKEERIKAVQETSGDGALPKPRLWVPLYDEAFTYVSYGASGDVGASNFPSSLGKEDVKTYREYFKLYRQHEITDDCPLFDAQRLWVLPFAMGNDEDIYLTSKKDAQKPAQNDYSGRNEICKDLRSLKVCVCL